MGKTPPATMPGTARNCRDRKSLFPSCVASDNAIRASAVAMSGTRRKTTRWSGVMEMMVKRYSDRTDVRSKIFSDTNLSIFANHELNRNYASVLFE
jgi:hypothetical protein